MRRPRKFLTLILILLVINAIFFTTWYALGGRNRFRELVASLIGKAINAELSIGELHLSDRQIYARDISFATPDSLLQLQVESLKVQYNLYKLIFSGFKLPGVVSDVEILKPAAILNLRLEKSKPKPKGEPFKMPDLVPYFNSLRLIEGSVQADIRIPLKIVSEGSLNIEEGLQNINLTVINGQDTQIMLSAATSMKGLLSLSGSLDKGRIALAQAEIQNLKPLYIEHPDVQDFRTEISATATYSEPVQGGKAAYEAKVLLWDTSATVLGEYPLRFPSIIAEADTANASARIARSSIGNSSLEADLKLWNYTTNPTFDGSTGRLSLDLSMILPELSGIVEAEFSGSNTFDKPIARLTASSSRISYEQWTLENLRLSAGYQDDEILVDLPAARWENQSISLGGSLNLASKAFYLLLNTNPIQAYGHSLIASGSIEASGLLLNPYPMVDAKFSNINVSSGLAELVNVNGHATLVPADADGHASYYIDAALDSDSGFALNASGDLLDQTLLLGARFSELHIEELYALGILQELGPIVSGELDAIMQGNKVWVKSNLELAISGPVDYRSRLDLVASGDLQNLSFSASIDSPEGFLNNEPIDFSLAADYRGERIRVYGLKLNDLLSLSGSIDPAHWQDMEFSLGILNATTRQITRYYPDLELLIPDFQNFSFFANYGENRKLSAWLSLNQLDLISLIPLNLNLWLDGPIDALGLSGDISGATGKLLDLTGSGSLLPRLGFDLVTEFSRLALEDVLIQPPGTGLFAGMAQIRMPDIIGNPEGLELIADVQGRQIRIEDFSIDQVNLKAAQFTRSLVVDTLYVASQGLFTAEASGALDYNALTNEFFEGNQVLNLAVIGQLFPWLRQLTPYIQESRGVSNLSLSVSTRDDQFLVQSGSLDIHSGFVRLKDQVEAIREIELNGRFDQNRFIIQRGRCAMGNGRLIFDNVFEADPSEHFNIAFLDLGILRLMIEEPGLQATIPVLAPPRSLSNIALKGQTTRFATIRGPFDDMKISAHVTVANADILFPPGADNLLNLINSVRQTGKKPETEPPPLPFTLDIMVVLGENVRYVTYPTNLSLQPGSFLHLIYDGNTFIVEEAFFSTTRGTVDLFGTVFQVEEMTITMIDQQDILSVEGSFYKRAPDGSTITLSVTSSPDYTKSFFDRLELNLSSDNPADRNIAQVLARLRYNKSVDELSQDQRQNLLQDEAINLIGGNLNSSVLTPFFYPVENWIRRALKLDSFSINAGFIQNLFTEYSSDPSQLAELANMQNFTSDIYQFSSSILLNNLSISMSKYLGYRFYVDNEFMLQEATDLQNKTRIVVSNDASLRVILPRQYRLGYTLHYSPKEQGITHEVMLQKSWRFWGLMEK